MQRYQLGRFCVAHIGFGAMQLPGPGTSSVRHLEENLSIADIELDDEAQQQLAAVP